MKIRNPRTGQYDYEINILSAEEVKERCANLKQGQQQWAEAGINKRIEALQQWKLSVEKHKRDLLKAICTDTGRKWESVLEVDLMASSIDRWCGIAKDIFQPSPQKNSSIPFINLQQELVPAGLVGVISPWNFPLLLSLIDTIPALLAGCSVIVKPSEVTPRFIKVIQKIIEETTALRNVFAYIEGDGSVGAEMIHHCDLICFTGSTSTGKKVYEAASKNMVPVFLEMGGKDPAIVLDGADIDMASSSILWGSTANAGQSCLSIERVYVQENIFDSFVSSLVEKAKKLFIAYPSMDSGVIAPIIFEKQVSIINEQLKDALNKGATILCGSSQCEEHGGGYYLPPTVLIKVNHQMKIMQEETFGPVIPVMKFKAKEEAIALANGTIYGLSAAVFAATKEEAMELGKHIEGGAISINDCALTAVMHEGEKNSFKLSGIGGTRMGPSAIKRFMKQKVFIIKENSSPSPWWYKTQ
jgi:succinate-semialdehyde dehydrogenase / glutarate-semialdehyde dehydrogenase